MSWIYEQSTGRLKTPMEMTITSGYSGAPGAVNNPGMQSIKDVGCIPRGWYTFGEPMDTVDHGPEAIPLTPDPDNEMFGRSGFYMHGDNMHVNETASEGCVIMPRFARDAVVRSEDKRLLVA